jgi:hypothetical protein
VGTGPTPAVIEYGTIAAAVVLAVVIAANAADRPNEQPVTEAGNRAAETVHANGAVVYDTPRCPHVVRRISAVSTELGAKPIVQPLAQQTVETENDTYRLLLMNCSSPAVLVWYWVWVVPFFGSRPWRGRDV